MVNQSKREYLAAILGRYRRAGRKFKQKILDEFCSICGYHRKHAIRLLRRSGVPRREGRGKNEADSRSQLVTEDGMLGLAAHRLIRGRSVGRQTGRKGKTVDQDKGPAARRGQKLACRWALNDAQLGHRTRPRPCRFEDRAHPRQTRSTAQEQDRHGLPRRRCGEITAWWCWRPRPRWRRGRLQAAAWPSPSAARSAGHWRRRGCPCCERESGGRGKSRWDRAC